MNVKKASYTNSIYATQTDYQVVIDVTRYDSVTGGDAVLTAFWDRQRQGEQLTGLKA